MSEGFGVYPVEDFLAAVAAREPAPGAGAVAAVSVAAAAGLVAMAARFSATLADADAVVAEADGLRLDVVGLADRDAVVYGQVLAAYRAPAGEGRAERIREALREATEVPARIATAGARAAELGALVAGCGNPNLIGDAHCGVLVAEAATRAAANLVRINVELGGLDVERVEAAQRCVAAAAAARDALTGLRQ